MYCPVCSQQQISDVMRFCSRCGFPLTGVREVIASGGTKPEIEDVQAPRVPKGVRRGVWTILASFVFAFLVLLLSTANEDFLVLLLIPFLSLVVGFLILLYGTFLEKRTTRVKGTALPQSTAASSPEMIGATRRPALSPPQVAPMQSFNAPRIQTAEMVQPPSVTERTTRLLEEETESGAK
jgi:hypothetical protein